MRAAARIPVAPTGLICFLRPYSRGLRPWLQTFAPGQGGGCPTSRRWYCSDQPLAPMVLLGSVSRADGIAWISLSCRWYCLDQPLALMVLLGSASRADGIAWISLSCRWHCLDPSLVPMVLPTRLPAPKESRDSVRYAEGVPQLSPGSRSAPRVTGTNRERSSCPGEAQVDGRRCDGPAFGRRASCPSLEFPHDQYLIQRAQSGTAGRFWHDRRDPARRA